MNKSGKEYLSKLFFELSKFSFIALTLAGSFALFTKPAVEFESILMTLFGIGVGIVLTILFGYVGYKLSKSEEK
jgi:hypothetical protein